MVNGKKGEGLHREARFCRVLVGATKGGDEEGAMLYLVGKGGRIILGRRKFYEEKAGFEKENLTFTAFAKGR